MKGAALDPLDMTLPPELRDVVIYERSVANQPEQTSQTERTTMSENIQDQIKATASQVVADLLAQKDKEQALFNKFAEQATATAKAEQAANAAKAELATANEKVTQLTKEIETAKSQATEQVQKLEGQKAEAAKKIADLEKANAELSQKLQEVDSQRVIASRTEELKALGDKIATADRINRVIARRDDGTFVMNDDAFKGYVEDVKALATALTPATPAPGQEQTPPAKAEGEQKTPPAETTPAAPDLSQAAGVVQATAALLHAGTKPSESGTQKYAEAFGA